MVRISISHLAPAAQLAELEWHLRNETDPGIRAVIQAQYEEVHEQMHGRRSDSGSGKGDVDEVGKDQ